MNKIMATGVGLLAFGVVVTMVSAGHWMGWTAGAAGAFVCWTEIQRQMYAEKIARFRQSGLPDSLFEEWEERYDEMRSGSAPESFLRDWESQVTRRHQV